MRENSSLDTGIPESVVVGLRLSFFMVILSLYLWLLCMVVNYLYFYSSLTIPFFEMLE